jgi:uncharacterized UBP type Zn finger protein
MPRGLINSGNVCFFNSAVQALFHVPALARRFRDESYDGDCAITRHLCAVVVQLLDKSYASAVDPSELLDAFRARFPHFTEGDQHDSAEVVRLLVDVLENSLGKPFICGLFEGTGEQVVRFPDLSDRNYHMESVKRCRFASTDLLVPEPGLTLEELLKNTEEPEAISDYVDHDGARHSLAIKTTIVTRYPPVCIFTFGTNIAKLTVQLPDTWDGRKLSSVIMHQGRSQNSGHYLMAARVHGDWWIKNDSEVVKVDDANKVTCLAPVCAIYSEC